MTIKDRVQSILKEKNISAQKAENDLEFAKGYISKLDKASPSVEKIAKIAEYLGVSIDLLVSGKEKEAPAISARATKISMIANSLPDEGVSELDNFAEYLQQKYQTNP